MLVTLNQRRPLGVQSSRRNGQKWVEKSETHIHQLQMAGQPFVSHLSGSATVSVTTLPTSHLSTKDSLLLHREDRRGLPKAFSMSPKPLNQPTAQTTFALPLLLWWQKCPYYESSSCGLDLTFSHILIVLLLSVFRK